jgi:hypothetical protein
LNVVAYDFRGHGGTQTADKDEDFSLDTLSTDSVNVINQFVKNDLTLLQTEETPKIIIVGHSMGGGIAAKTASLLEQTWLKGVVLVDIVEGTAIAALPSMHRIVASRPSCFKSVSDAIYWACKSKTVLNSYSARISVPSQLVEVPNGSGEETCFKWRTNLLNTEPYWKGTSSRSSSFRIPCTMWRCNSNFSEVTSNIPSADLESCLASNYRMVSRLIKVVSIAFCTKSTIAGWNRSTRPRTYDWTNDGPVSNVPSPSGWTCHSRGCT